MVSACPACKKNIEHEDFLFEVRCADCGTRFNPFMTVHESHDDQAHGLMQTADAMPPDQAPPVEEAPPPIDLTSNSESYGDSLGAPAGANEGDALGGLDAFSDGNLGEDPFNSAPNAAPPSALSAFDSGGFDAPAGAVEPDNFGSGFLDEPAPSPAASAASVPFGESNELMQELRNFGEGLPETPSTPTARPAAAARPTAAPAPVRVAIDPSAQKLMTAGDTIPGFEIEAFLSPLSVWTDLDSAAEDPMKKAFDALWRQAQTRGGNAVLGMRWALTADGKVLVTGTPVRARKP